MIWSKTFLSCGLQSSEKVEEMRRVKQRRERRGLLVLAILEGKRMVVHVCEI